MKRSLLLSICTVAIVAMSFGQAKAVISLSLNLRYNNPANTSAGGTWDLLARTNNSNGISGLAIVLDGITKNDFTTPPTSDDTAAIVLNGGIGAIALESKTSGTITEFVYGQDPNSSTVGGVGTGSGAGNVAKDDLFSGAANSYDNMAKIASGFFGSTRPSFTSYPGVPAPSDTAGQNWVDNVQTEGDVLDTITLLGGDGVRGDSVSIDGLLRGDANRDGIVNISDLTVLGANFSTVGTGTWNTGDFTGDGNINISDLTALGGNFSDSSPSPALTAVPEPSSIAFVVLSIAGLAIRRNRSLGMC